MLENNRRFIEIRRLGMNLISITKQFTENGPWQTWIVLQNQKAQPQ